MAGSTTGLLVGRLTRGGQLIGFLAVDDQVWREVKGVWPRRQKSPPETRRRYRLDLMNDWDEGFLTADDEAELASGRFLFKGETWQYEGLADDERRAVIAEHFSDWK